MNDLPDPDLAPNRGDIAQFLTFRILQLHRAMNDQAVALLQDRAGLTQAQWRIIATIGSGMAASARDISHISTIDPAQISRTVHALEKMGLLVTTRPQSDRRVLQLALTEKGRRVYQEGLPLMRARQQNLIGALDPDEREAIFRIIDKLERAARRRDIEP